jgi:hypothetical protein
MQQSDQEVQNNIKVIFDEKPSSLFYLFSDPVDSYKFKFTLFEW